MDRILVQAIVSILLFSASNGDSCPPNFQQLESSICYEENSYISENECPFKEEIFDLWRYVLKFIIGAQDRFELAARLQGNDYFVGSKPNELYDKIICDYWELHKPDKDGCLALTFSGYFGHILLALRQDECKKVSNLCIYRNRLTFCEAFDEICSSSRRKTNCFCESKFTEKFFCRQYCSSHLGGDPSCNECDDEFTAYPDPTLSLTLGQNRLFLDIHGHLKLKPISDNDPIICYCDSMPRTLVTNTYNDSNQFEFILKKKTKTHAHYEIKISKIELPYGKYWCKGFSYPDFEEVSSNVVAYRPNAEVFIFNFTLPFEEYNPLRQEAYMKSFFKDLKYQFYPVQFHDDLLITMNIYSLSGGDSKSIKQDLENLLFPIGVRQVLLADYCPEEIYRAAYWSQSRIGQTVLSGNMCLNEKDEILWRKCIGDSLHGPRWSEPNGYCISKNSHEVSNNLLNLLDSNDSSEEALQKLQEIVQLNGEDIKSHDIYLIGRILDEIPKRGYFNGDVLMSTISDIMGLDEQTLRTSQESWNATDMILHAFDKALAYYFSFQNSSNTLTSQYVNAASVNLANNNRFSINFSEDDLISIDNIAGDDFEFSLEMTDEFLNYIHEEMGSCPATNLIVGVFKKPVLFAGKGPQDYRITGWIPQVFLPNFEGHLLRSPIIMWVKPHRFYRRRHFCSYWKYGVADGWQSLSGAWAKDHEAIRQGEYLKCEFWHMTHFGILLDNPRDEGTDLVSIIGSFASLSSVFFIYATAFISRKWRQSQGAKLVLHFNVSIILQTVFLHLATVVDSYEQESLCIVVGLLLHFSIIAQFCWMLIFGLLQYRRFVIVLAPNINYLMVKCCLIGWVCPFMLVLGTLIMSKKSYLRDQYCYLTGTGLYFGVFLPVSIVIFTNVLIFLKIFIELKFKKKPESSANSNNFSTTHIKLAAFLFFVLGLSWSFGLLSGFFQSIILSYLFCIAVSIQGIVLLLFHVFMNRDARTDWKKLLIK